MDFSQLALIALLVEAIIQTIKPIYDKEKGWNIDAVIALIVGIALCVLTKVDLFKELGLSIAIPYVGSAFTGILASRGSNAIHDLLKVLQAKANPVELGGVG